MGHPTGELELLWKALELLAVFSDLAKDLVDYFKFSLREV